MAHHTLIARLGPKDRSTPTVRAGSVVTDISFVSGSHALTGHGIDQALKALRGLGLRPSETSIDLVLLAALITAADTRISRRIDAQDTWTRQIDLLLPVADVVRWTKAGTLIDQTLRFLTGDQWNVRFHPRPKGTGPFALDPDASELRATSTCVCLFSGGLDSFIGAIDLLAGGETPLLVSHYWDGLTSSYQDDCVRRLQNAYTETPLSRLRSRVGFGANTVPQSGSENTLRARSFTFFALAALAADSFERPTTIHVPENGLISLNVPLDPLRVGSLSTRTTHPYFMARFSELLARLGIQARLLNRYRHQTKGQMVSGCQNAQLLRREAKHTMSCSSPAKARWKGLEPMHCGYCVPCLIRRASLLGVDKTSYTIPDLKARALKAEEAEGTDVRSFQLALARLTKSPTRARFDIHKPGPLTDHPGDLGAYEKVYRDGLAEVGKLLKGVRVESS